MLTLTLIKYCNLFQKEVDGEDLRVCLESSPQYPSLLSIIKTLRYVGLDAQVGQCEWDYLKNLDAPVLIHVRIGNKQILVIAKWDFRKGNVRLLNLKNSRWGTKNREDLIKYWDGVVIYTTDHQIDRNFRAAIGIVLSVVALVVFLTLVYTNILNLDILFYSPIILGIIVSSCLYMKSDMKDGGMIDKLCHISKVTDCKRVGESKYGTIYGLKMNCLSLSFFIAQAICVSMGCLSGFNSVLYPLYFISTVISLPTIIYSTYGQVKVRNICPLCVVVAICIVIEAIIFICWDYQTISIKILTLFCCLFLFSLLVLQYISYLKSKNTNLFSDSIDLLKLKRNKEVIRIESFPIKPISSPVGFGDGKARTNITTILSPSCSHCRKVASELISLRQKGLDFRWNIILGRTTPEDPNIIENWINQFLRDEKRFFDDLILWSKKDKRLSISPSQNSVKESRSTEIGQIFDKILQELNVSGFPQIFLNNRSLSSMYTPKDIEFILMDHSNTL